MRWLVIPCVLGLVCGGASLARADRADELEAWLRREQVRMARGNDQRLVLERERDTVFCARAGTPSAPTCVIERDPHVHDVSVDLDSRSEGTLHHYCLSWRDDAGVAYEARWDRRRPGTSGPCVEDTSDRPVGRAGLFSRRTAAPRGPVARTDLHLSGHATAGLAQISDTSGVECFAPPSGWVCTSSQAFFQMLGGEVISFVPISGVERYLVHSVAGHSHVQRHVLSLVVFEADDVRALDRLVLGQVFVGGADPGPPFAWRLEGDTLSLLPRTAEASLEEAGLGPRYRLEHGRFDLDRADDLERWLRRERVVSVLANRHLIVVEREGATLFCVRVQAGEPVCVIEHDRAVRDVFATYDSFREASPVHYCLSWVEGDGERRWARWDLRAPGTSGRCVEDYNVTGVVRDATGRSGLFATPTAERVALYASSAHVLPTSTRGMRVLEDDDALCFAAPAGWVCTPARPLWLALTADRIESITPVGAQYLIHAIEGHSHRLVHTLALVSFEGDDVHLNDTLRLGHTIVLGVDPGPPYVWRFEGTDLVLEAPVAESEPGARALAGRYRLVGGRFERLP
jgi:hypothetical protein